MEYKGIKNVNSSFNKSQTVKRKSLHFFSCCVICLLMCALYNISFISELGLQDFIVRVTSNWTPKPDDFGKIKFVNFSFNNNQNSDGIFMVSSPFKNYFVTNITPTLLQVNGLGDVVVISPIDGTVQTISFANNKYSIAIVSSNVIVNLNDIDYPCIGEGAVVKAGDKIAVSLNSLITFSIVCSGEYINLPATDAGNTFFE